MNPAGADIVYEAANYAVTQQQLANYVEKVRARFPGIASPLYPEGLCHTSTLPPI